MERGPCERKIDTLTQDILIYKSDMLWAKPCDEVRGVRFRSSFTATSILFGFPATGPSVFAITRKNHGGLIDALSMLVCRTLRNLFNPGRPAHLKTVVFTVSYTRDMRNIVYERFIGA